MKDQEMANQAQVFSALADPTRLKLLKLLSDNRSSALCVNAMAAWLGVSQPAVSQHLRVLRNAGLISGARRGYHVHYVLETDAMKRCQDLVSAALGTPGPVGQDLCHDERAGESRCDSRLSDGKQK